MKEQKMFEELGYSNQIGSKESPVGKGEYIMYSPYPIIEEESITIGFDIINKKVEFLKWNANTSIKQSFDVEVLNAIHQQMKDLNWIK